MKKVLSLILAATMCLALLTGCAAKPEEEFMTLYNEMSAITQGNFDVSATIKLSEAFLEKAIEENESLSEDEIGEVDIEEIMEDWIDSDGNLVLDINVDADVKNKDESKIKIKLFDEHMDVFLDEKDIYIETDGLFDILEAVLGEEISVLKMFIGDYDYIKTTIEPEDESESTTKKEMPAVKDYISAENVTKQKDGSYIADLGNNYVKDALSEDALKTLGLSSISNSSASLKILKNKNSETFNMEINTNIEGEIDAQVIINITPGDVNFELPDDEDVLDTSDESSMNFENGFDLDFSGEIELNPEDMEITVPDGVEVEWITEDDEELKTDISEETETETETDNSTTPEKEISSDSFWVDNDITIDYEFEQVEYELEKVLENPEIKGEEVVKRYQELKPYIDNFMNQLNGNNIFDSRTYSDKEYNSYSTTYERTFDKFDEEISLFVREEAISLSSDYYLSADFTQEVLSEISERIEETLGVIVPVEKLTEWINTLKSNYKEDDWSINANYRTKTLTVTVSVYDGNELNIHVSRDAYGW